MNKTKSGYSLWSDEVYSVSVDHVIPAPTQKNITTTSSIKSTSLHYLLSQ